MEVSPVLIFDVLDIIGLHLIGDVEIVVRDYVIKKLDSLVLAHILDAQQALALGHMPFVVGRSLLVRRVELPYSPVVHRALLDNENARRLMADRASFSRQRNTGRPGTNDY